MMEMVELNEKAFTQYRRKQIAELRPWREGDDMVGISVSREDMRAGSPRPGDMIARNPKNHADQWLVAAAYFADNFEPATALQSNETAEQQVQKLTAENEKLREALEAAAIALDEAAIEVRDWGEYAGEYFQDKHDLEGCFDEIAKQAGAARSVLETQEGRK